MRLEGRCGEVGTPASDALPRRENTILDCRKSALEPAPDRSAPPCRTGIGRRRGGAEGVRSDEKISISLYFNGLRRKNREKARRKPAKIKPKAGENRANRRPETARRRVGPSALRRPTRAQAGAAPKPRAADTLSQMQSLIAGNRTMGISGSGDEEPRGRAAAGLRIASVDDGGTVTHPLPRVKRKISLSIRPHLRQEYLPTGRGAAQAGGAVIAAAPGCSRSWRPPSRPC